MVERGIESLLQWRRNKEELPLHVARDVGNLPQLLEDTKELLQVPKRPVDAC